MAFRFGKAILVVLAAVAFNRVETRPETVRPQQRQPAGKGTIAGRTVDAATGRPIPGVTVSLYQVPKDSTVFPRYNEGYLVVTGTGPALGRVLADADGRFRFSALPDGFYELSAFGAAGSGQYGQSDAGDGGRVIGVDSGKQIAGLNLRVWRRPVIEGRVIDESGRPVPDVEVFAIPPDSSMEQQHLGATDDRGLYEISPLPGEYSIAVWPPDPMQAAPANRQAMVYPVTFFPGTLTIDQATRITVTHGELRTGLDIQIRPVKAYRISGKGGAVQGKGPAWIRLTRDDLMGRQAFASTMTADIRAGSFTMSSVVAGRYHLRALVSPEMPYMSHGTAALTSLPPDPTLWMDIPVTVTDRDLEIPIDLSPGFRISGTVTFEGAPPPALKDLANVPIVIEPAGDASADLRGLYLSPSTFTTIQVPPGRYFVRAFLPNGWYLKTITAGGRDVTDAPIEIGAADRKDLDITFTNQPSMIRGTVDPALATDLSRAWVTVFPADRSTWAELGQKPTRLAIVHLGTSGFYETKLPPGTYFVVATDRPAKIPGDFARLSLVAETVALASGATATQNLKVHRFSK